MLNKKQELFCLEYMKHHRAGEAYEAAGFESKTRKAKNSAACRLLKKPEVQARIKAIEILLRAHGAFETNINVTTAIPVVISGGDSLED